MDKEKVKKFSTQVYSWTVQDLWQAGSKEQKRHYKK